MNQPKRLSSADGSERVMVSRQQSRVLRYVRQGRVQKLGAYLRKHRRLQLNFSQGRRHRSLLHVACSQGDAAVLRVLLEHGADPLRPDRRGDTALHLAARRYDAAGNQLWSRDVLCSRDQHVLL
uniref:NF-kappa-B inhibitor-like protein 1 n=1 Tax=Electrophorus electricus TaxID=8005 RepID=A0A4W4HRW2_ELEEL